MSYIYEECIDLLNENLVEKLGWTPIEGDAFVRPFSVEGAASSLLRWRVSPRVFDLGPRIWMNCEFALEAEVSSADAPSSLSRFARARGPETESNWSALYESSPFHETTWAPTTAGCVDLDAAAGLVQKFVLDPTLEFAVSDPAWLTTSKVSQIALTSSDGYRVDPKRWRTAVIVLAMCGHPKYASEIIDEVGTRPRMPIDSDAALSECRAEVELISTCDSALLSLTDDGLGVSPPFPRKGDVVPARASLRRGAERTVAIPEPQAGPELLEESFLGFNDLETWEGGMSILDVEFFVYDIAGATTGDRCGAVDAPVIERHLLDTFASWDEAARPENRDLLDRYQRHLGQMVLRLEPGRWAERWNGNGFLDPFVQLDSGNVLDPTVFIREALIRRSGETYARLADVINANR